MRAFVQTEIGRFEGRELPVPRAGPGEVVVRVRAALTCGTDVKMLTRGHPRIALPVTMGHELSGEVVETGEGVSLPLGQRVVPGVSGPCGRCTECASGRDNLCARGHADRFWGAFAEFARIPAAVVSSNLHAVPEGMADEVAAFLDPLASVLHGWERFGVPPRRLLVYGAGALGLLWAAAANGRGVESLVAGRRPQGLALARSFGAGAVDVAREEGGAEIESFGADSAVDCTGDAAVWERLADLVGPGGRVLLFGGCAPGSRAAWDAGRLHYSEVSLIGSFHYTPPEAARALALLSSGEIDPRPLISGRGGLADLPAMLEAHRSARGIRYAVTG